MSVVNQQDKLTLARLISNCSYVISGMLCLMASSFFANSAPTEDGLWYYEIGGAQVVPKSVNPNRVSLSLSGSAQLGLGYSCGKFDPVLGVAHTLNQVKDGTENMLRAMTNAATGAIASLPALILQRANPGLYDLMQNALVGAKLEVDVATKNCRQMESEISQGKNPYHELIVISKGNDWKKAMSIGGNNAVAAQKSVDTSNGNNGVPWVLGADAGGQSQPTMKMTADVVHAAYNVSLNRAPSSTSAPSSTTSGNLTKTWGSPQDASTWVGDVVGEHEVSTCDGCPKSTVPGKGLLYQIVNEANDIATNLDTLVSATTPPSNADLGSLSGPNLVLSRQVIEALRELNPSDRLIVQSRLVNDIAVSRTLEKAFYARRLLLTGGQLPEVATNNVAKEHVEEMLANLDDETERLRLEYDTRRAMVSNSVSEILSRARALRNASRGVPELGPIDQKPLINGRIPR